MRRLIILGGSNFAQAAHYYFANDSDYEVVAFTVDAEFLNATTFQGLPVVAFEELQQRYPPQDHDLFVAVGLSDLNRRRAAKVKEAEDKGYHVASYVSSRAVVPADLRVEPNTWIMETAHVMPYVRIGRNSIIWGRSTIAFNCEIGDHCWIVGAVLGESIVVGENTFIGIGATIAPFTKVGKGNIIGAGALILKDTKDFQIYREDGSVPSSVPSTRFKNFNG
jgi:sugar O-acyltransferase (sialic acid O-acetyltransferase NeuD family)